MNRYPTEVTVIVYSVRNIVPKKKDLKYCVIFSVGSVKFRTDQIADDAGSPEFNAESSLIVENPKLPLSILVTEKKEKEFYGQLVIPLDDLPTARKGAVVTTPLQPHKKCQQPTATISYEAWVSKTLHASEVVLSMSKKPSKNIFKGIKKTFSNLNPSSKSGRKNKYNMADGQMSGAHSCVDLYNSHITTSNNLNNNKHIKEEDEGSRHSIDSDDDSKRNHHFDASPRTGNAALSSSLSRSNPPFITELDPCSGLITGGTRIIIRGSRLGNRKEDIVGLFVCGSNVLNSLEYTNSSEIACTTKAWKLCSGCVTIETQSGGKASSELKFTFKCDEDSEFGANLNVKRADSLNAGSRCPSSTNLAPEKSSPPAKKSLGNKLTLGLSNSFLSRSLMNLSDSVKEHVSKVANHHHDEPEVVLQINDQPYLDGSYNDLASSSRSPHPPIVHITPIMGDGSHHKSKDTVKVGAAQLKELEQQLFTWQKAATNLSNEKKELETENQRLKSYIDKVVFNAMNKCPEILSIECGIRKMYC